MPNQLGTLTPAEIVLEVVTMLKKKFPSITAITTDFSSQAVKFNQQVISRVVVPQPAQDYDTTNGYVAESAVTQDVAVTINKHKHVSLAFNDQELSATNRNLPMEQVEGAAYSLGRQIASDLWALATVGNFGTPASGNTQNDPVTVTGGATNVNRLTLLNVRRALIAAGAAAPRIGIINADAMVALGDDLQGSINSLNYNQEPDFDEGVFYNLVGFEKIVEYPDLPSAIIGWFGSKAGLVFASRVPADPGIFITDIPVPAEIKNVTDPDTGLTIQYRYMYDPFKGKLQMTLTLMYGVAVGVPGHVVLLTAAS
jgi:hypothetical protein